MIVKFGLLRFLRDRQGAVAPAYAIAIPTMIAVAGVGFDYSRMASLDTELQNAADQAALAGATQLDGNGAVGTTPGACQRAAGAVLSFVRNHTRFANDGVDPLVTFQNEATCDATGMIRFWKDKNKANAAATDAEARFIEVVTDVRAANYALTPIIGAFRKTLSAGAMAGLGSSVCKVPPLMLCSPDPSVPFNADGRRGQGVVATGHSTGHNGANGQQGTPGSSSNTTWSPGDFGFLQVQDPDATNTNAALLKALAYNTPTVDCVSVDNQKVSTGNPQNMYDAINTRFDIYDFPSNGNGNVLAPCQGGACSPAPNVTKDFTGGGGNGNNACKINNGAGGNPGWRLPADGEEFKPIGTGPYSATARLSENWPIAAMGLPRDNCHYTSYGNLTGRCAGSGSTGRFGNGEWARKDYFDKNHPSGARPSGWETISRYQTYLWELGGSLPSGASPVCASAGSKDRRLLTVAVVKNCASLTGASSTVSIDEFVDVFLVEPSVDSPRRHNAFSDAIYIEIIGKSKIAGSGTYSSQQVRRDVPYLVR